MSEDATTTSGENIPSREQHGARGLMDRTATPADQWRNE
jgi:hypothetical protein